MLITLAHLRAVEDFEQECLRMHGLALDYQASLNEQVYSDYEYICSTKQEQIDEAWDEHDGLRCGCCPCCRCSCWDDHGYGQACDDYDLPLVMVDREAAWEQADKDGLTEAYRDRLSVWECPPYET